MTKIKLQLAFVKEKFDLSDCYIAKWSGLKISQIENAQVSDKSYVRLATVRDVAGVFGVCIRDFMEMNIDEHDRNM